jgi:hypothetical protein
MPMRRKLWRRPRPDSGGALPRLPDEKDAERLLGEPRPQPAAFTRIDPRRLARAVEAADELRACPFEHKSLTRSSATMRAALARHREARAATGKVSSNTFRRWPPEKARGVAVTATHRLLLPRRSAVTNPREVRGRTHRHRLSLPACAISAQACHHNRSRGARPSTGAPQ